MIALHQITGIVLAGGRGTRMGGADKGLQPFRGKPLAQHALQRLRPQVGQVLLNANRNQAQYAAFGAPVWPDAHPDYPGPLAGFLCGLTHCTTPWLLTVACDTPLFPTDLAQRLAQAASAANARCAVAASPETGATGQIQLRRQPVFCLLHTSLLPPLQGFIDAGGYKAGQWLAEQQCAVAPFNQPGDAAQAFGNANTLTELHLLQESTDT